MKLDELDFSFPENLIATQPSDTSRVMRVSSSLPREVTVNDLLQEFSAGDVLVLNDSRVVKRRVFVENGIEVLFLSHEDRDTWQVLMPLRKLKNKDKEQSFELPGGIVANVIERGRPQKIKTSQPLEESFFEQHGELPLPPYIQKARGERVPVEEDQNWYQTAWAAKPGSLAAPTASFHFTEAHIQKLRDRGVHVETITLHVGLGTFLPVVVEDLKDHQMHSEEVFVSKQTWQTIREAKERNSKVWGLGTTVTRSLESCAHGFLHETADGFSGATDLFITPGFEFKIIDRLMTNFHQPKTTLLSLVMAFAGQSVVEESYRWAVEKEFRLFSYGDLSVWGE